MTTPVSTNVFEKFIYDRVASYPQRHLVVIFFVQVNVGDPNDVVERTRVFFLLLLGLRTSPSSSSSSITPCLTCAGATQLTLSPYLRKTRDVLVEQLGTVLSKLLLSLIRHLFLVGILIRLGCPHLVYFYLTFKLFNLILSAHKLILDGSVFTSEPFYRLAPSRLFGLNLYDVRSELDQLLLVFLLTAGHGIRYFLFLTLLIPNKLHSYF